MLTPGQRSTLLFIADWYIAIGDWREKIMDLLPKHVDDQIIVRMTIGFAYNVVCELVTGKKSPSEDWIGRALFKFHPGSHNLPAREVEVFTNFRYGFEEIYKSWNIHWESEERVVIYDQKYDFLIPKGHPQVLQWLTRFLTVLMYERDARTSLERLLCDTLIWRLDGYIRQRNNSLIEGGIVRLF